MVHNINLKIDMHVSLTSQNWTPIFPMWYVDRCGSKNIYQKDKCLKEIELHAPNMITIPGSIVNKIRGEGVGYMII